MPPRPKRRVGLDWNPALRDDRDDDNGTQFKERVEPKLEPKPKPKVEPKKEFPSDPVSRSSTEYTTNMSMKLLQNVPKMMRNPSM